MKNQKEKSFVDFDEELVIENKILHNIKFGVYTIKVEWFSGDGEFIMITYHFDFWPSVSLQGLHMH